MKRPIKTPDDIEWIDASAQYIPSVHDVEYKTFILVFLVHSDTGEFGDIRRIWPCRKWSRKNALNPLKWKMGTLPLCADAKDPDIDSSDASYMYKIKYWALVDWWMPL